MSRLARHILTMRRDDWVALFVAVMTVTVFGSLLLGSAFAQDMPGHIQGHAKYHDVYKDWKQPGTGYSCCDARIVFKSGEFVGHCYPTPHRLVDGHWQAKLSPEDGGEWINVPEHLILHEKNPDPSGVTGHLCWNHYTHEVLCDRPPTGAL